MGFYIYLHLVDHAAFFLGDLDESLASRRRVVGNGWISGFLENHLELEIMVRIRGIIPIHGRKIHVSEQLFHLPR